MVLDGGVWRDEVAKWRPGLDITEVPYSRLVTRRKDPETGGSRMTDEPPEPLRRKWGTVIVDECHYLKNPKAHWTKAFKKLRYERLILLTGTPLPNWAHEAFTLLQLMWPDEAKPGGELGSYWRWVKEWFEVGPLRGAGGKVITEWHIGNLRSDRTWGTFQTMNWGARSLRRLRKDCLDLPPFTETTIHVDLKGEQKRVYNALRKDFVTWLDSGEEIVAWNTAAQWVKLFRAATALPNSQGAKIDALREILQDRELPTLVVAHFRDSVHAAQTAAVNVGKQAHTIDGGTSKSRRAELVRSFQAGHTDVLCATIDTISEGLTLNAADQVILLERSPRPSRNEQVVRRIHRIGQTRPVTAVSLIARGTVDERIETLLRNKLDQQMLALPRAELRGLA